MGSPVASKSKVRQPDPTDEESVKVDPVAQLELPVPDEEKVEDPHRRLPECTNELAQDALSLDGTLITLLSVFLFLLICFVLHRFSRMNSAKRSSRSRQPSYLQRYRQYRTDKLQRHELLL